MVTVVVGNVDLENSIETIGKYLNKNPNELLNNTYKEEAGFSTNEPIKHTIRTDIQSLNTNSNCAIINLSFITPNDNNYKESILAELFPKILDKKITEYNKCSDDYISAKSFIRKRGLGKNNVNYFSILSDTQDKNTEHRLKTLYSILYNLAQKPIENKELNKIKNELMSNFYAQNEYSYDISEQYANSLAISGSIASKTFYQETINSVTSNDIMIFANKYLDLNKASLVVIHPHKKSSFDQVRSTNNISFKGNASYFDTENIKEYELPNNLRVVIDSRPGVSKTTVRFDLHSKRNVDAKPSAALLLNCLLVDKEKLNDNSINIKSNVANTQFISSSLSCEPGKTLLAIDLIKSILLNSTFSQEDFSKTKKNIKALGNLPQSIEGKIEQEFSQGSPYKRSWADINNVEFQDVKNLYSQILQDAQGTIIITIPKDELNKSQNRIFDSLLQIPKLQKFDFAVIFNKIQSEHLVKSKVFIEPKDTEQVYVKRNFKIIESGNIKDRAGLFVLNEILGGSEHSRLFNYLRNGEGITYNTSSYFKRGQLSAKNSSLSLECEVNVNERNNKDNLKKVIDGYQKVIDNLITNPISDEELKNAKVRIRGSMISDLESSYRRNLNIASTYNSFYGINYFKALDKALNELTPDYIQQLAKYYLTQPSYFALKGNKKAIDVNENYLSSIGELVQ